MKKILIGLLCLFPCLPAVHAAPRDINSKIRTFTWTANTETDLAGYKIYHEKKFLVDIPDAAAVRFECLVEDLLEGINTFNVTAYDESGNESDFSADAIFFYDGVPPAAPKEVMVE